MAKLKHPKTFYITVGFCILVGTFAYGFLPAYIRSRGEAAQLRTPEGAAAFMAGDLKTAPMVAAMRTHYPQEFTAFTQQLAALTAAKASQEQMLVLLKATMARHVPELVQAPADQLNALRSAEQIILTRLKTADPATCGRYVATGAVPASAVPADLETLVAAYKALWWQTAAAGRDRPAGRSAGQLDNADAEALRSGMIRGGVTEPEYAAFVSDAGIADLPPEQQCKIAVAVHQSVAAMPAEAAARVTATIYSSLR